MKKIITILTILPLMLLIVFSKSLNTKPYYGALLTVSVLYIIFMSYFYFEKSSKGVKDIAIIATLSSFAAISRVPFVVIPNVQPVTFIVALSGLVFGSYNGFIIGATAAFVSNIFLGQGPWTPWQMLAWGVVGALSGILGYKGRKPSIQVFAIICFAYGFVFGFIMNLWCVLGFVKVINIKSVLLTYINAVPFDLAHAIGNFLFVLFFYEGFYKILLRFYHRVNYIEK
ncbi:ECF transporter S component [Inconstantimicrobium mannanitabidum]|uniref:Uncharacterized protein n=1 Tax=Inconstantimicrobium mannanitabidum TaxID=1604901 RepID=A0ACB5RCP1_9CLOT|nr:ECF transporter S component [Clostridium sp. TW13]GKX67034.1 hypothetical protein rsdtw13_22920 [Clostridium sp. TW13]